MARGRSKNGASKPVNGNGAHLGFEAQMFLAADKLRKNLEPSDYKHVALGLIFLKHISNAFEAKQAALLAEDAEAAEDPDEYLAENIFGLVPRIVKILKQLLSLRLSDGLSTPSSCRPFLLHTINWTPH